MTYAELDSRVGAIASALSARHARGERALLLFTPGLDYVQAFLGCLRAGVIAVPAYPPLNERDKQRLGLIVADADARIALTTSDLLPLARTALDAELTWFAVDGLDTAHADPGPPPELSDVAFLQYTSGSTRAPRGVILSHGNLAHNLKTIQVDLVGNVPNVMVSWLPPYHDMGLIGAILEPLYAGFPAVLMSPLHFLQKPFRWLRTISEHRGTISPAPNFAFELCLRRVTEEQRASLDLRSWRVAVNGAEPVRATTVRRFTEAFAQAGFSPETMRPSYGLAEATLLVSCDPVGVSRPVPADGLPVPCGTVRGEQELVVVDRETLAPAAPGTTGEIWVSGPSVAGGYWRKPRETEALFQAVLPDGRGPFLCTGDLGSLDEDGVLTVAGRLKDLIIVSGRNVYPQDVELAAEEAHRAVRPGCGAAFSVSAGDEEQLVLVAELADGADADEVVDACRQAVYEKCAVELHALVLIEARTVPKTSSGKIQRSATREAYRAGTLREITSWSVTRARGGERTAPRTPLESLIGGLWADLLGVDQVDVHEDFLATGAQSLQLAQLAVRIEAELPVLVTTGDIFKASTVARLAALLEQRPMVVSGDDLAELIAPNETP